MQDTNQRVVNDAAAFLFWKLAERVGVQTASNEVLATNGSTLFRQDFSNEIFDKYGIQTLDLATATVFKEEVAAHAVDYCRAEENIIGSIYVEDLTSGRAPSAKNIDVSELNNYPESISGVELKKFGKLCVRHPLPAVVVCNFEPTRSIFQIEDTVTALGFTIPLYMGPIDITQIADDMWLITGIIHIPVPSTNIGKKWNRVIQNNISMVDGLMINVKGVNKNLDFNWQEDNRSPLEIILNSIKGFFK